MQRLHLTGIIFVTRPHTWSCDNEQELLSIIVSELVYFNLNFDPLPIFGPKNKRFCGATLYWPH